MPIPWAEGAWTDPWLPIPARWDAITADKQEHDPGSTLNFYRAAIRLRRGFRGDLEWLDAPDGVLAFRRGDRRVVVNLTQAPVAIDGRVLIASGPITEGVLPTDTAAWLA